MVATALVEPFTGMVGVIVIELLIDMVAGVLIEVPIKHLKILKTHKTKDNAV